MRQTGLLFALTVVLAGNPAARGADNGPYNDAVVKFCESKVGKQVGAGECSHLADEALRVAGAEFTQTGADGKKIPDSPAIGDYVWGKRVKTYSYDEKAKKLVDSDPSAKCQPGDIIQFDAVKLTDGATFPHHTAVVRTVDDAGNPSGMYQQNVKLPKGGDGRIVMKSPLRVQKMIAGSMMIYRPSAPANPLPYQFTLTNNSKSESVEFIYCGRKAKLGAANTRDGFRILWATRGADSIYIDGKGYRVTSRKGYEFYTNSDGKIGIREVE